MSNQRKVHGDAKLKTLPAERQAAIFELLKSATLAKVRAELAKDGLQVGTCALSEFRSWYAMREAFEENAASADSFMELLKKELPELDQSKVAEFGDQFFNLMAVRQQDPKLFLAMQTAKHRARMDQLQYEQKERELALNEKKFQRETAELFIKWFHDEAAKEIVESDEPAERKIERIQQRLFGEGAA